MERPTQNSITVPPVLGGPQLRVGSLPEQGAWPPVTVLGHLAKSWPGWQERGEPFDTGLQGRHQGTKAQPQSKSNCRIKRTLGLAIR